MYARYAYNTATAKQLLDDLVTLFTSTTTPDLSTLTSCVAAASTITTQYDQAGWTLFDTPDANSYVLQAPVYDNATKFKYLYLSVATAGFLQMVVFDDWDATAHTGTYPSVANGVSATPTSNDSPPIALNSQNTLYISANARRIIIYSLIGTGYSGPYGVAERSRVGAWDTASNMYCNTVHFGGVYYISNYAVMAMKVPYIVNASSPGLPFITNPTLSLSTVWGYANSNTASIGSYFSDGSLNSVNAYGWGGDDLGFVPAKGISSANASKNTSYALTRLNVAGTYNYANEGGSLSDASSIFLLPRDAGNPEDTVLADGTTYILMGQSYGRFVLPNG